MEGSLKFVLNQGVKTMLNDDMFFYWMDTSGVGVDGSDCWNFFLQPDLTVSFNSNIRSYFRHEYSSVGSFSIVYICLYLCLEVKRS